MKNGESKNRKLRINAIDILIIVLIFACITAMILRFTVLDNLWQSNEQKEYVLTFKVDSLTSAQLDAIILASEEADVDGNWVYLDDGKTKLGEIVKLGEQNKETLRFVNENGETVTAEYSESENEEDITWTVTGTINCSGVYTDNKGFLLNGKQYIASNSTFSVFTKYCDFELTVIDIEELDKR